MNNSEVILTVYYLDCNKIRTKAEVADVGSKINFLAFYAPYRGTRKSRERSALTFTGYCIEELSTYVHDRLPDLFLF